MLHNTPYIFAFRAALQRSEWDLFLAGTQRCSWDSESASRSEANGASNRGGKTAHGLGGDKFARIVNRLLNTIGGVFAVIGNVGPDIKNIRFGKRRQNVSVHFLDKRQSSFIA
jgi:hypothetical protein